MGLQQLIDAIHRSLVTPDKLLGHILQGESQQLRRRGLIVGQFPGTGVNEVATLTRLKADTLGNGNGAAEVHPCDGWGCHRSNYPPRSHRFG
jgi:hypothetical protein